MAGSIHIMRDRITRRGWRATRRTWCWPRLAHLGADGFRPRRRGIAVGMDCVRLHLPLLRDVLNLAEKPGDERRFRLQSALFRATLLKSPCPSFAIF